MSHHSTLKIVLLGIVASLALASRSDAGTSGLIARWALDDGAGTTATDSVGTSDGTLNNFPAAPWNASGGYDDGGTLTFDGWDDYIDCGADAALNPTSITVAFWMKATSLHHSSPIDKLPSGTGCGWSFRTRDDGEIWFRIGAEGGDAADNYADDYSYEANTWVHVAGTFDDTSKVLALYIGGVKLHFRDWQEAALDTAAVPLLIGKPNKLPIEPFNGQLQDVRIYGRALSESEIVDIMTETLPAVSIEVTDANAAEAGTDTGAFTVSRVGSTIGALTVNLEIIEEAGTEFATSSGAGTDYTASPDVVTDLTVTIPDGQASVVVTITPIDDAVSEADETITISLASGGAYTLTPPFDVVITCVDDDVPPGAFTLSAPIGGAEFPADADIVFTWTTSAGAGVTYEFILAEDISFSSIIDTSALNTASLATTTVTLPADTLELGQTYYWSVEAHNASGDTPASNNDETFDTEAGPPTVLSTIPADGSVDAELGVDIQVVFSAPMNEAVTQGAFSLQDSLSAVVAGSVTWSPDGTVLTFNPSSDLGSGAAYTVTITDAALDLDGSYLDGDGDGTEGEDYTWAFDTKIQPPTVLSTSPSDGSDDIDLDVSIEVVFSAPMDETATEGAFALRDSTGFSLPGSFGWSADGKMLTFSPNADLEFASDYTASVNDTAMDLNGTYLDGNNDGSEGGNRVWTFVTLHEMSGLGDGAGCAAGLGSTPDIFAILLVAAAIALTRRHSRACA